MAVIRGEMWAFKSRHFWRIHQKNERLESRGDPVELTAFWYGLPANVDKVDAVYERETLKFMPYILIIRSISNGNQNRNTISYYMYIVHTVAELKDLTLHRAYVVKLP